MDPDFSPARSVTYALRGKIELELESLTKQGVLEAVEVLKWAAPIVAVPKHDLTSVRIC